MTPDAAITTLISQAVPWMLVLARIAGLFIAAPMLLSFSIPMRYRTLLAVMMAAAAFPTVRALHTAHASSGVIPLPPMVDVYMLAPIMLSEMLIGFVVGAIAALPLLAMEASGVIMGQSIGFGLARVYNPESDADTDLLGQLLFYVASGLYFALGGVEALFSCILSTFERVPLGTFATSAVPLDLFVGVLASGFELALRVALPVVGVVLLIAIVLGAVGKTMPQINVMSVGFTIKMLAGLLVLALAMYSVGDAVEEEVRRTLDTVAGWTAMLASSQPATSAPAPTLLAPWAITLARGGA